MFLNFFTELRAAKVPVTLKEYLMLMEGMDKAVIGRRVEEFYYLSRSALVKDEKNLDRFDVVFGHVFKGLELLQREEVRDIPAEWLKRLTESFLTEEEKKQIEEMGGFEKLMEALQERMKKGRGEGDDEEGDENSKGNGRNFPHRRGRLPPRGHPHRPGQGPSRQGDQGLGQARIQESRRRRRARHTQHQDRATSPAQVRPAPARPTSWT